MAPTFFDAVRLGILAYACYLAYDIRLGAVNEYGMIIHEFDPWFNYRATEYLSANGYQAFTNWFDDQVWYPLGRHVGSTVYPGMMLTSVFIHRTINLFRPISLNDVCCMVPAWFGVAATLACWLMAREVTTPFGAVAAAMVFAICPAHLMRSVAGGYDNESIAVFAMCMVFFCWMRSLRTQNSWPWGIATGFAYIYMVAAWGGYTFVLNMVGIHCAVLVFLGQFDQNLHRAYSLFYVIGTIGAIQFPIVGLQPLKSLEQIGCLGVFLGLQILAVADNHARSKKMPPFRRLGLFLQVMLASALAGALLMAAIWNTGYLGPFGARIRGLFIQHTRTGNPLVDSVAEHQPTNPDVYSKFFHHALHIAPVGAAGLFLLPSRARLFIAVYSSLAYYFSAKMMRLVLLLSPGAAICAGIFLGWFLDWAATDLFAPIWFPKKQKKDEDEEEDEQEAESNGTEETTKDGKDGKTAKEGLRKRKGKKADKGAEEPAKSEPAKAEKKKQITDPVEKVKAFFQSIGCKLGGVIDKALGVYAYLGPLRKLVPFAICYVMYIYAVEYKEHCVMMSQSLSHPQIILKTRDRQGRGVTIDDFREAYWWLRDNTREDARVMAWWDYGYQINGVGNRTSLADGNTWNHEHIALLGKMLVSSEKASHKIARHLADYVLVWTTRWGGMSGDDIAKSPHMARIGGSVFKDINAQAFYMDYNGQPSPMMRDSLLYRLHHWGLDPNSPELKLYEHVFTSKHRMVRIYKVKNRSKESKKFCRDALDWAAEHGGGGKYPPALDKVISKRKAFKQFGHH